MESEHKNYPRTMSSRRPRLQGKVALVTGASRGIGADTARLFAEHGARVVIADVLDDDGRRVATEIGGSFVHCDVGDETQVERAVNFAAQTYGGLDVLLSNAGVVDPRQSFLDLDLAEFDRVIGVNARGVAATIKHAARAMVASKTRGSIICQASIASVLGGITPHGYSASKHAVVGLVKSACSELGVYGIRVNAISPSGMPTPLTIQALGSAQRVENKYAAIANLEGVALTTADVAGAALFLASDDAAYISGHNLVIDGGLTVVKHGFGAAPH